jgi:hypothetical protein
MVKTGITDDSFVEVVAGKLRQGEKVIVEQILPKKKPASKSGSTGPRF